MHSSRMRTGRSLTVCLSLLLGGSVSSGGGGVCSGGGCLLRGVSAPEGEGVSARGGYAPGGCLFRGVFAAGAGCLLWGVSARGGCLLGGGVVSQHALRQTTSPVD